MLFDEPFGTQNRKSLLLLTGTVALIFLTKCVLKWPFNIKSFYQTTTAHPGAYINTLSKPKLALSEADKKLCLGKGFEPSFPTSTRTLYHLDFRQETFIYLKNLKNPCFFRNVTYFNGTWLSQPKNVLRCVPYFFIIGMPKCGTTDLWHGLELHPDIAIEQVYKESKFFNIKRYPVDVILSDKTDIARDYFVKMYEHEANWTLDMYLDYFHNATLYISNYTSDDRRYGNNLRFSAITGDGTVGVSHDNDHWNVVPGNENCTEPIVLNANYLYKLNPKMRLIIMFRNPVERLFSNYLYDAKALNYSTSVEDFHQAVIEAIKDYNSCLKYFTDRGCTYNSTIGSYKVSVRIGIYHVFLEDWFRLFSRDQILIIRFEDYIRDRTTYLKNTFKFLDIRKLSSNEEAIITNRQIWNSRSKDDIKDMMPKTRKILHDFYRPFNMKLSVLLNDTCKRFLWDERYS